MIVVETNFTDDMIGVLTDMKGKTFKSYECVLEKGEGWASAAGSIRLNLGQYAVDLYCVSHDVVIRGSLEEMAYFTCEKASLDSGFVPYVVDEPNVYMVGERIVGIDIVQDIISVSEGNEEFRLCLDVALVVKTSRHVFTFSRGVWFDEEIDISVSDKEIVIPYTVDDCNADWADDPEENDAVATTTRTTVKLA